MPEQGRGCWEMQGSFGPGSGQKVRPWYGRARSDDDDSGPNPFQMMSTAEVQRHPQLRLHGCGGFLADL